jgi:UDP-N-acetylglucosamine--N-acetylmuramyl-(pentapeptide) pyrophosphoryl-undecaprenol N-acetylglucosamine transferase
VADAFRARASEIEITFFGPRDGRASALAACHGCDYRAVSSSQIARVGPAGLVLALARTLRGIVDVRRVLAETGITLVVGFGGFASGAVVIAARSRGLTGIVHEANVVPGRANRWLGRVASRVFTSEWTRDSSLPAERMVVTGWPVRADIAALAAEPRSAPADRPIRLLVCSGSRGGAFFAGAGPAIAARLAASGVAVEARHQSGDADPKTIEDAYARLGVAAGVTSFDDDMAGAYRWADIVMARAGAGTIAEIALAGVPALLVPLPDAAEDHQSANARAYAGTGAAVAMDERACAPDAAAARIRAMLAPRAWMDASAAARRFATPRAAEAVVRACEQVMADRW